MNNEDFINAGYVRFDPPPYENCITDMFQKCFRDENGKRKYFITVERWDYTPIARGRDIPISYNFTVQFEHKDSDGTVNMDCFSGWTIEGVEKFFDDMWRTGWFKYYDKE